MMTDREHARERLMKLDEQFRKLIEEHRELDRKTTMLSQQEVVLPGDRIQIKELKKKKLLLKDQIEKRLLQYLQERET